MRTIKLTICTLNNWFIGKQLFIQEVIMRMIYRAPFVHLNTVLKSYELWYVDINGN